MPKNNGAKAEFVFRNSNNQKVKLLVPKELLPAFKIMQKLENERCKSVERAVSILKKAKVSSESLKRAVKMLYVKVYGVEMKDEQLRRGAFPEIEKRLK